MPATTITFVFRCACAGKSKYALEEEQKDDKPDFREGLHKHEDKAEDEEGEAEEGGEVSIAINLLNL